MFKSTIISALVFQLIWAPFAYAQGTTVGKGQTKAEEPDLGAWKSKIVGSDPTGTTNCDPWSICNEPGGTPGWLNTGPSSGWDDPTTPLGSSWGISQPFSSVNQLEDSWAYMVKMSDVVSAPYEKDIVKLIRNNATKNQDEIADIIIGDGKFEAASWGAVVAVVFFTMNYLVTKLTNSSGGVWSAIGTVGSAAVTTYWEFYESFRAQAGMILRLDALYGGIGDNPTTRLNRIKNSFAFFSLLSGLQNLSVQKISGLITSRLLARAGATAAAQAVLPAAVGAAATAATAAATQAAGQAAANAAAQAELPVLNAAVTQVLTQAASKETGTVAIQGASGTVTQVSKKGLLTQFAIWFKNLGEGGQKIVAGAIACFITAIVSVGINYYSTWVMGHTMKVKFQRESAEREAEGLATINQSSEAKHALWLILTRDVFNRMVPTKVTKEDVKVFSTQGEKLVEKVENKPVQIQGYYKPNFPIEEQQRYANLVAKMLPLVNSQTFGNEFDELAKDFKENPKMIDNYLNNLRDSLSVEAKIWFMKIILTGMYVKGRLNDGDVTTLHTVARFLALEPPPGKKPADNDVRNIQISRYALMVNQIEKAIADKQRIVAGLGPKKNLSEPEKTLLEDVKKRGVSGQVIYEQFKNVGEAMVRVAQTQKANPDADLTEGMKQAIDEQVDLMVDGLKKEASMWEKIKKSAGF